MPFISCVPYPGVRVCSCARRISIVCGVVMPFELRNPPWRRSAQFREAYCRLPEGPLLQHAVRGDSLVFCTPYCAVLSDVPRFIVRCQLEFVLLVHLCANIFFSWLGATQLRLLKAAMHAGGQVLIIRRWLVPVLVLPVWCMIELPCMSDADCRSVRQEPQRPWKHH